MTIKPIRQSIKLESRTESLKLFREFVQQTVSQAHLSDALTRHVVLACDEAVTSIIRHASANHRVGSIELDIDVRPQLVSIEIVDSATNFEEPSDTLELLEHARSLELGVFLIRQIMDQVDYVYRKGKQNRLTMVKYLPVDAS